MARKIGLGKGLDALIPSELTEQAATKGAEHLPISQIALNPLQPRNKTRDEYLDELTASIREHGILQPLIVTKDPDADTYTLIAGERRLRAAKLAGLEAVPVIVRDQASDQLRLELALIENLQREDLSPLEAAQAYQQLTKNFGLSHEEIALRVGKSRTTVTNTLRLLKLPTEVLEALSDGNISEGHARALLGLNSSKAQKAALQSISKNGLNVRQSEELVRKLSGQKPLKPTSKRPVPPEVLELEEKLRSHLGTKVTLRYGKRGGTVIIYYYSEEELEALIARILH
ncbi:MAG TPA: ParB/RepB/Spo0J family partition protein [Anaerolineae bacterium]|nr:ParB/RepB/Spo0J family partition protein [Anaerolineae bacterium]